MVQNHKQENLNHSNVQVSLIYNTNDLFDGITSYAIRFTRPVRSTYGDFYIGSKRRKSDYLSVSGQFVT